MGTGGEAGKQILRACGAQDDSRARFGEGKENCRGAACCAPTDARLRNGGCDERGTGVKRTRMVPNSSNDVLNSARSVVSSAVVSVTPGAAAATRSGPPSVSVANALSFTLTVMRPAPMSVAVSTDQSAVARTGSAP